EIGGRSVGLGDGKKALVAAAPAAKALCVEHSQINCGVLFASRVGELHGNAGDSLVDPKRQLKVGLAIGIADGSLQHYIGLALLGTSLNQKGDGKEQYKKDRRA